MCKYCTSQEEQEESAKIDSFEDFEELYETNEEINLELYTSLKMEYIGDGSFQIIVEGDKIAWFEFEFCPKCGRDLKWG